MKLNTDGTAGGDNSLAGYGGVIRDNGGHWIKGFCRRIGATSSFVAELRGLREGLMLCRNLNISSLVIQLDAKTIVDVLNNPSDADNIISSILDDCKLLVSHMHQIWIKHCFHQANRCPDRPPVDMIDVYEDDLKGMYFNRICPEPLISFQFLLMNCLLPKKKKNSASHYLKFQIVFYYNIKFILIDMMIYEMILVHQCLLEM